VINVINVINVIMPAADTIRLLVMTCPEDQADGLLGTLLAERLVACGNIIPGLLSRYWWQGELARDAEVLVLMETAVDRVDAAIARLAEIHPYEVAKILAFTPVAGHAPYLEWVHQVTRTP
jgi:periplasmic divalent cation tolerance protein